MRAKRQLVRPKKEWSARRWEKHGAVQQTLRNWSILTAENLGVSPDRLADFYAPPHGSWIQGNRFERNK